MHHLHILLISGGVFLWLAVGLVGSGFYNAWWIKVHVTPDYAVLVFSSLLGPISLVPNLTYIGNGWSLRRRRKVRPYNTYMQDRRRRHDDDGCDPDL